MCVCVCACVCPARVATPIFGGLITARRVDALRGFVLSGDAIVTCRVDTRSCLERACLAVVARRVDARRCLVLSGDAIVCPQHMWCVCVFVCMCV